jgi:CPA2 family monovalent cation:H+ antiporter-2
LGHWLEKKGPTPPLAAPHLANHVVVIGYGRVGEHIVTVLERLAAPCLVVERDATRLTALAQRGVATLFGDAANSEVLMHAHLTQARALVVTVPDETTAELVVATAQDLAPTLPIIARAASVAGCRRLTQQGAQVAIQPELEGGLEIVRHTLLALEYPLLQVQPYIDAVRQDRYDTTHLSPQENQMLEQLVAAVRGMEIVWQRLEADSPLLGQTLAEANLRAQTGASVVALVRNQQVIANPEPNIRFDAGDLIGLIGAATQVAAAQHIISPASPPVGRH